MRVVNLHRLFCGTKTGINAFWYANAFENLCPDMLKIYEPIKPSLPVVDSFIV